MVTAGIVSDAVTDAIATAQGWFVEKIEWVTDPVWLVYWWVGLLLLFCMVVGFFAPFKWVRAGLGVIVALGIAFAAGARHMNEKSKARIADLRAQLKKAKQPKKDDGWKW